MALSMTGYGSGIAEGDKRVTVEVKTVNHRFLDLFIRMPRGYLALEDAIRKEVSSRLSRGRVEVFVTIEDFGIKQRTVKVDWGLVKGYETALKELEKKLQVPYQARGEHILRQPDILVPDEDTDYSELEPLMREALTQAIDNLMEMRRVEGDNLAADLEGRIETLRQLKLSIAERAPQVVEAYRDRLASRIRDLLGEIPIDEDRLALELAVFADKTSITEELVRLESHLEQFMTILRQEGPIGRKLDFLIQEINREYNTIGSKATDSTASQLVVDAKAELEKIREQVQNIE